MAKKNKKKLSSEPEFSLNSEPEKRETQDNGFFFEDSAAAEKSSSEVKDSEAVKAADAVSTEEKVEEKAEEKAEVTSGEKPEEKVEATEVQPEKAKEDSDVKGADSKKKGKKDKKNKKESDSVKAEAEKTEMDKTEEEKKEEKAEKSGGEKGSTFAYFFRIAGVLTLICSFVALMLASVDMITKDVIAQNAEKEKTAAVTQIFTEADDAYRYEEYLGDEEVYLATKDGKLYGYCVSVISQGYGGEISMMVGIRYDGNVQGVKIVSMSETAGLGSKTKNDSFLNQYIDKKAPFSVGENVDAVAGATISSKAVTAGVNAAFDLAITPASIAARNGISLYNDEGVSSETESEEISAETEDQADTTMSIGVPEFETDAVEGTHIDPASVGQYQSNYYYQKENSYTWNRENGHYLEKETTDTESETEEVSDGVI